ncbi:MAG: Holliday junction resolvase RuvX [Phycisphaerae bacterium]|nr:Holliday junction resolvase RuvX [Phycisphaerae bacterium]
MRYLAIDHGQKRTGLAISDASETLVSPHAVIETSNQEELLRRILKVIDQEQIDAVVIGLPLNMDDSEGPRAKRVRQFVSGFEAQTNCPVILHDERLSSFEADCLSGDLNLTRKKKKKRLDAIAAAAILRSFIEQKSG